MIIKKVKGTKGLNDFKFLFTTKEDEPITLFKVFELINQLGINEWNLFKERKYKSFFFVEAINELLGMVKNGVDWSDVNSLDYIKDFCKRYNLCEENVEFQLKKIIKLGDFGL